MRRSLEGEQRAYEERTRKSLEDERHLRSDAKEVAVSVMSTVGEQTEKLIDEVRKDVNMGKEEILKLVLSMQGELNRGLNRLENELSTVNATLFRLKRHLIGVKQMLASVENMPKLIILVPTAQYEEQELHMHMRPSSCSSCCAGMTRRAAALLSEPVSLFFVCPESRMIAPTNNGKGFKIHVPSKKRRDVVEKLAPLIKVSTTLLKIAGGITPGGGVATKIADRVRTTLDVEEAFQKKFTCLEEHLADQNNFMRHADRYSAAAGTSARADEVCKQVMQEAADLEKNSEAAEHRYMQLAKKLVTNGKDLIGASVTQLEDLLPPDWKENTGIKMGDDGEWVAVEVKQAKNPQNVNKPASKVESAVKITEK